MPKEIGKGRKKDTEELLVREFVEGDAPGLARMYNESDEGWPGGFTRGIPYTPERVLHEVQRGSAFARLVVELKGKIVGYCTLGERWGDKDAAYVGFLNISPSYQGKGFGRRLLLRSVEEATKRGVKRLDLHTWSGNMKAMPLYKKTGFFWVPRTSVYMQNYLPRIFSFPAARDFFGKHPDWYRSFKRELKVKEDDFKLGEMKIFPYEWQEGGDKLRILVDREVRDITGAETNDFEIHCWVEEQEAPAGIPLKIHWKVANKTGRKVSCSLLVDPDEGIKILEEPPKSFIIGPRGSKEFVGRLLIKPGIEDREEDEASHKIKSNLILDGRLMPLATGLRVKQPVDLTFDPHHMIGRPGFEESLIINIRNHVKKDIKGEVLAVPPEGVQMSPSAANFRADANGFAGVEYLVRVSREMGNRVLPVTFLSSIGLNGTKVSAKPKTYYIKCVDEGGAVACLEDDKELVLTSQALTVSLALKGGHVSIRDNVSGFNICDGIEDSLGPPFWPPEFATSKYQYELDRVEGSLKARLRVDSQTYPGVRLVKQITLSGGSPILNVAYSLINNSSTKYDLKLQVRGRASIPNPVVTMPLNEGYVRATIAEGDFPRWEGDVPEKPDQLKECWSCFELPRHRLATGLMWNRDDIVENSFGGTKMPELVMDVPDLLPQSTRTLRPLYLFCGYGDWKTVREYYRRLIDGKAREELRFDRPRTRPPIDVIIEPSLVTADVSERKKVPIKLTSSRMKPLSGKVRVDQPTGWRASLDRDIFRDIERQVDWECVLSLQSPKTALPGCYEGRVVLELQDIDYEFPLNVMIVGKKGDVRINLKEECGMRIFSIDNGLYVFKVCPEFAGTLYSAIEKRTGEEHLLSSFPKPKPFVYFNPWHGGIGTLVFKDEWPGKAHEERWNGRRAEIGPWKGVTVYTNLTDLNENLKGLEVATSYLTRSGSNIICMVNEYRNATSASTSFESLIAMFLQLGGPQDKYATIIPGRRGESLRRGTKYSSFASTDLGYAVVTNQKTGNSICLATTQSERATIEVIDMAVEYGAHLTSYIDVYLKPNETRKFVNLAAFTKTKQDALKYKALRKYRLDR